MTEFLPGFKGAFERYETFKIMESTKWMPIPAGIPNEKLRQARANLLGVIQLRIVQLTLENAQDSLVELFTICPDLRDERMDTIMRELAAAKKILGNKRG